MNSIIKEYTLYNESEIIDLYKSVGWINYVDNPDRLKVAYSNSLLILGAYDNDKLVGIIRVVGDGVSIVFVQDIIVLPEYQRQGIGSVLLRAVMEKYSDVYQMELMTDNTPKTVSFYESLGFKKVDNVGCCSFIKM